jgi:hypothetical protein
MTDASPAKNPCGSCPYRKDTPSGVWAEEEYDKLPAFDLPTHLQPFRAFFCHQQDGRLCAGWVGCHDMEDSLGLRMAVSMGLVTPEAFEVACNYTTDVPLWESGAVAAEHGKREINAPSDKATRTVAKLERKLGDKITRGGRR